MSVAVLPWHGLELCAGIGGLGLGLQLAVPAYRSVVACEIEAYASAILVQRQQDQTLPPFPVWDDVKTFDGEPWRGAVDIVLAGYPCQPFSIAGPRRGEADPRHLWPAIHRIIGEAEPSLCFFENTPNHLRVGFSTVHDDLRALGYRVAAGLFSAAEVGASHLRKRLYILACRDNDRAQGYLADPNCQRIRGQDQHGRLEWAGRGSKATARWGGTPVAEDSLFPPGPGDIRGWQRFDGQRPDLYPTTEPEILGSLDGTSTRMDQLRAIGNAVVPLVAATAFRSLCSDLYH